MGRNSETARERELYRYFQPSDENDTVPGGASGPRASNDFTLTALAQLGALRLNAKRGLIILAARSTEYIIAEAGKSLSLQEDSRHDRDDALWHGVGRLDKKTGMGSILLNWLCSTCSAGTAHPHVIVNDLTKDDRFKDNAMVTGPPFHRFCACFPIISPDKYVLGFYLVVDDKPREDLTGDEIQFLEDMAATVMDHLKSVIVHKKHYRAERMVKALGLFLEGKSSLRDWWIYQGGHNLKQSSGAKRAGKIDLEHLAEIEFGVQDAPDRYLVQGLKSIGLHERPFDPSSSPSVPLSSHGIEDYFMGHSGSGGSSTPNLDSSNIDSVFDKSKVHTRVASDTTGPTSVTSGVSTPHGGLDPFDPHSIHSDASTGRLLQEALVNTDMKTTISRAANLIREAIGLDGAIFYDANIGSVGGSRKKQIHELPGKASVNHLSETTSSSDEDGKIKSKNATSDLRHEGYIAERGPSVNLLTEVEETCHILGYSTRTRSSLNGHSFPEEYGALPVSLLKRLLKRYPQGKVFHFEEDGSISSGGESDHSSVNAGSSPSQIPAGRSTESQEGLKTKKMSREQEAAAILRVLPGARSVIFFPLWDSTKNRWYSGSVVWSKRPTRVLCPMEDILYMTAFGNSVMSELSRLSALIESKMKTDFTSSISHELRSPLHGVLASVEFLQETTMTDMQVDMVNTIHSCGKTLLDTINHVLDYSKVNKRVKETGRSRPGTKGSKDASRMRGIARAAAMEDVDDIANITEEVIDSVYAGYKTARLAKQPRISSPGSLSSDPITSKPPVTVITDIEWRQDWNFHVDAGAWRRILMDLFSNSMKYTSAGFVRIAVKVQNSTVARNGKSQSTLSLTVTDSGKGISQEFLKNHLYTPFMQEDALAPGTGLGLSIVRRIVRDLGGTIHFTSEQGSGTEAKITLPLISPTQHPVKEGLTTDIISEVQNKTKGLKASLVGFDHYPDIVATPDGILSAEAEGSLSLKSSISSILGDWFGMQVAISPVLDPSFVGIHVLLESNPTQEKILDDKLREFASKRTNSTGLNIVLVLCSSSSPNHSFHSQYGIEVFHVSQPFGPHKLANVLHRAFYEAPMKPSNLEMGSRLSDSLNMADQTHQKLVGGGISTQSPIDLNVPINQQTESQVQDQSDQKSPPAPRKLLRGQSEPYKSSNSGNGLKVLLVEDNEVNLKLLIAYMHKLGLDHATAINGLEALNSYQQVSGKFDVIFMDISMPVMDGLTASREIRQFERQIGLPATVIIALTGAASMSARQEAFNCGIDLFLTKPVPMKRLKVILEDLKGGGIGVSK